MAFARDQVSSQGSGFTTTVTTPFTNGNPSASSFVVFCVWLATTSVPTVSDNAGNAYYKIVSVNTTAGDACHVYYTNYKLKLPGAGTLTPSATLGTVSSFWGAQAASYTSSTAGTVTPDLAAMNTVAGTGSGFQYGSGVPAQSGELYISAMGQNSSGSSEGISLFPIAGQAGNYSLVGTPVNNGATAQAGGVADFLSSDTNVRKIDWIWSANDTVAFSSAIVPFLVTPFLQSVANTEIQAVQRAALR